MRVKKAYKIVLKDIKENAPRYMVGKAKRTDTRFINGVKAVMEWICISANEDFGFFEENGREKEDDRA